MRLRTGAAMLTGALSLACGAFVAHGAIPTQPAAQPAAFAQCRACHAVSPGAPSGVGPNLFASFGAAAGTKPGFAYSPAMRGATIRWDRARLDAYLADPEAVVPGTRMRIPGVKDPAARKAIVKYLAALR